MSKNLFLSVAAMALMGAIPAMAQTNTVTEKTNVVHPDGSVTYNSQTVVTKNARVMSPSEYPAVTFYYYEPVNKRIVSASDLTPEIIDLWDTDHNKVIDNHEFYNDSMVMYEPASYSKRTYQDINGDGIAELTKEEYTTRLTQLPMYSSINKNGKEGLDLHEFTGLGFQDADNNNDNQVSYAELREAFYHQQGLIAQPEKINN